MVNIRIKPTSKRFKASTRRTGFNRHKRKQGGPPFRKKTFVIRKTLLFDKRTGEIVGVKDSKRIK